MATMQALRKLYKAAEIIRQGDCKSLRELLKDEPSAAHWSVSDRGRDMTFLHLAAEGGKHRVIKILLDHGAEPHRKNRAGVIALSFAIHKRCNKSFYLLLPGSTSQINDLVAEDHDNKGEQYRLLWQAMSCAQGGIAALIEAGADPHLPIYKQGITIFEHATSQMDLRRTAMLLEAMSAQEAKRLNEATPAADHPHARRSL